MDQAFNEEFEQARIRALQYVGADPGKLVVRVKEILLKAGYGETVAEEVIQDLLEREFIDEELYCQRFAKRHSGRSQKSRRMIAYLLKQKGADSKLVDRFVDNLPADGVTIANYLNLKYPSIEPEDRDKVIRHLIQRGYAAGLAQAAVMRALRQKETE